MKIFEIEQIIERKDNIDPKWVFKFDHGIVDIYLK